MSCISDYQYDDRHGHAGWEQTMARDARLTTRPEDPRLLRDPAGQVQKVGRPRIWCCEHQNRRGAGPAHNLEGADAMTKRTRWSPGPRSTTGRSGVTITPLTRPASTMAEPSAR